MSLPGQLLSPGPQAQRERTCVGEAAKASHPQPLHPMKSISLSFWGAECRGGPHGNSVERVPMSEAAVSLGCSWASVWFENERPGAPEGGCVRSDSQGDRHGRAEGQVLALQC